MLEDAVLELFFRLFKNSLNQFSAVRLLVFLVCINVNCSSVFNLTLLNVTTPLELTPGVFHKCQSISVMFWMRKKTRQALDFAQNWGWMCCLLFAPPKKYSLSHTLSIRPNKPVLICKRSYSRRARRFAPCLLCLLWQRNLRQPLHGRSADNVRTRWHHAACYLFTCL